MKIVRNILSAIRNNFGSTAGTICEGNDNRLLQAASVASLEDVNAQLDALHTDGSPEFAGLTLTNTVTEIEQSITGSSSKLSTSYAIQQGLSTKEPSFTKNTAFNKDFGTTSGTVCEGDDSRLSPAGSDGYVQYNNSGSMGGDSELVWDDTNKRLGIGVASPTVSLDVDGQINSDLAISVVPSGAGRVRLIGGGANETGYIEWRKSDETRLGLIGYDTQNVTLKLENSADFVVSSGGDNFLTVSDEKVLINQSGVTDSYLESYGHMRITSLDRGVYIDSNGGYSTNLYSNGVLNIQVTSTLTRIYKKLGVIEGTPTASLHVAGEGITSATYTFKADDDNGNKSLYVRDDGEVSFRNYSFPISDGSAGSSLKTNGSGSLYFDPPTYGEIYQNDNSTATGISVQNTWYEVENFSSGESQGVTTAAGSLTVDTGQGGVYKLFCHLSGIPETATHTFEFAFSVNDTISTKTKQKHKFPSTSDSEIVTIGGVLSLSAADVIKLEVRNIDTGTNADFTVQNANITMTRIS